MNGNSKEVTRSWAIIVIETDKLVDSLDYIISGHHTLTRSSLIGQRREIRSQQTVSSEEDVKI